MTNYYNYDTFKEISKDTDNNEYMSDSCIEAINFDKTKESFAIQNELNAEFSKSVDAIKILENRFIFIEFKNKNISEREAVSIRLKYISSLFLFCDIEKKSINEIKEKLEFILVYNEEKNSSRCERELSEHQRNYDNYRDKIVRKISSKANEEFIFFGFNKGKGYWYKDVHTFTKEEFDQYAELYLKM